MSALIYRFLIWYDLAKIMTSTKYNAKISGNFK